MVVVWPLLLAGGAECSKPAAAATPDSTERLVARAGQPVATVPTRHREESRVVAARGSEPERHEYSGPVVLPTVPDKVRTKLEAGHGLALQRVTGVAPCRDLFAELGADGEDMLTSTLYLPPIGDHGDRTCQDGVAAYTFIGEAHTMVCDHFRVLSTHEAAMILLHEALHHAGLGERGVTPGGPTPLEINRRVAEACRLYPRW